MSVLVKDMQMPKGCMYCPFFNGHGCKATYKMFHPITNVAVRVDSCPLVEIEICDDAVSRQAAIGCLRSGQICGDY